MLGAIAGDIIGSVYERRPIKSTDFPLFHEYCRFTDDTVTTVAVASAILRRESYATSLKTWCRKYPGAGYGELFYDWILEDDVRPYSSWGNGAAMRVSPIGFAFGTAEEVLHEAEDCSKVSHNHPEGIKGAQATALAEFLARMGQTKSEIRTAIGGRFGYDLGRTIEEMRPTYRFDVSCQGTVPAALIAFFDARSYEEAIRLAISLGGDSDTLACICGGVAEAFYHNIPDEIVLRARRILSPELLEIVDQFQETYK